jgi:hypothetical protein
MKLPTHVLYANLVFLAAAPTTALAQVQLYSVVGPTPGEYLGGSVSGAGDIDADGIPDLLVGSPYSSLGAPVAGQVQAFSGQSGALLHTWTSSSVGENSGWACSPAGDYNHDGVKDIALSAFGAAPSGEVRVYSGSTGALLHTRSGGASEAIGRALAGGDINLDGWGDVVIGIASSSGNVRVISGSAAHLSGVVYNWSGAAVGDMFGRSVAIAGDLAGDGYPDVVVGAPGNDTNGSGAGMVRAFSGRTGLTPAVWTWLGDDLADSLGESGAGVSTAGFDDVIAGAPYFEVASSYRGLARIYSGRTGAVIRTLFGDASWLYFGTAVAGVGDLDGDGKHEVAVTSTSASSGPYSYGALRIFSGASGSPLSTIYGDTYDAFGFGIALASPGDLNGDGRGDLIVGASEDSVYTGSARSFLTGCAVPIVYCVAKPNSLGCLPAIAHGGAPSVSVGNNFKVSASNVRNRKSGIVLWGLGSAALPLGGGTLCCAPPITRTTGQDSGGSPIPASDCSGTYNFAFTQAYMASKGLPGDRPAQLVSISFSAPNNIGLTDAFSFGLSVSYFNDSMRSLPPRDGAARRSGARRRRWCAAGAGFVARPASHRHQPGPRGAGYGARDLRMIAGDDLEGLTRAFDAFFRASGHAQRHGQLARSERSGQRALARDLHAHLEHFVQCQGGGVRTLRLQFERRDLLQQITQLGTRRRHEFARQREREAKCSRGFELPARRDATPRYVSHRHARDAALAGELPEHRVGLVQQPNFVQTPVIDQQALAGLAAISKCGGVRPARLSAARLTVGCSARSTGRWRASPSPDSGPASRSSGGSHLHSGASSPARAPSAAAPRRCASGSRAGSPACSA